MKLSFWKTYKEIGQLNSLQDKRHPMFEKNKFSKFLIYFMFLYYAGILILMGAMLPEAFDGSMANFHVLDSGFFYLLFADFWCRFFLQQTPAQQMKPFCILPIRRMRIMDIYLIRAALSWGNLFLFCFLVPFGFLSVFAYYDFWALLGWLFGWWLLIVADSYWYLFCRALIIKNIFWLALPVAVDAALVCATLLPSDNILGDFFIDWLEQFIFWNPLAYLIPVALIALLFWANKRLQGAMIYDEVAKKEEKEMKHAAEFKALNRFGVLGEYLKLEIRMRTRNKVCRTQMITGLSLIVLFSVLVSFSDVYDNTFMHNFIALYNYMVLSTMTLTSIMGFEGNYIDGLMSRHESIYDLLRAKYFINLVLLLLPFLLMTPTMVTGKISLLMNLGYLFMTGGIMIPSMFQLAVYNHDTMPLNAKMTSKSQNWVQQVISLVVLFAPILIAVGSVAVFGETWGYILLIILGSIGIGTHRFWIRNIYKRFLVRRYVNMEGFRASRVSE